MLKGTSSFEIGKFPQQSSSFQQRRQDRQCGPCRSCSKRNRWEDCYVWTLWLQVWHTKVRDSSGRQKRHSWNNFPELLKYRVDKNGPLPTGEPIDKLEEGQLTLMRIYHFTCKGWDYELKLPLVSSTSTRFLQTLMRTMLIIISSDATKSQSSYMQILMALQRNNNILNWSTLPDIITNSNECIQNEHNSCDGIVKTVIDGSDNAKMCACQCHNSSYQLIKRMFGVVNQNG